jgi:Na+-transporting methylmalonyl-CoA/oxaloacetate decarboxylase gamma subunit
MEIVIVLVALVIIVLFVYILTKKTNLFLDFEDEEDEEDEEFEEDNDDEKAEEEYKKEYEALSKNENRENLNSKIGDDINMYFSKIDKLDYDDRTQMLSSIESKQNENLDETQIISIPKEKEKIVYASILYRENGIEKKFLMTGGILCIGRDSNNCDIVISNDEFLGRKHALVYNKGTSIYLVDLNSKNGTYIEDQRVFGHNQIVGNKKVKLANTEFIIKVGE